jgi:GNAT superfamily N-acetyltransferase
MDDGMRVARLEDAAAIEALIDRSVRALQAADYSPAQMDGAIGTVFGVDRRLIADGGYFVIEDEGRIVACGGWSWRRTLFGGDRVAGKDDAPLQPGVDAARVRAFFVAPERARQGLGSRIMQACEDAARAAGFTELELAATLTGVPLYSRHGFTAVQATSTPLANGLEMPLVLMRKALPPA